MKSKVTGRIAGMILLILAACAPPAPPEAPAPGLPPAPPPAPAERSVVRLGVILPQTGPAYLRTYAESILEGVRVAAAEHEAAGGQRVELMIRDDSGRAAGAAAAMRDLAAADVAGVVGPLTDAILVTAAGARPATDLVVIGPTATAPSKLPNVYALNVEDTAAAAALGRHAAASGRRSGVLHAGTAAAGAEARAFARAVTAAGGAAPLLVSFDSGATTMAAQIRRLRDAGVQQLFISASVRSVRQLLPQLGYYGLGDAQLYGGEAWAAEEFRRGVPRAQIDGAIVATVLPRTSREVGWTAFEEAYGRMYRRSLTSAIPALGFDAANIILRAKPEGRVSRADVARAAARSGWTTGATGIFRLSAGAATRRPFLMRIRAGALEPVSAGGS